MKQGSHVVAWSSWPMSAPSVDGRSFRFTGFLPKNPRLTRFLIKNLRSVLWTEFIDPSMSGYYTGYKPQGKGLCPHSMQYFEGKRVET